MAGNQRDGRQPKGVLNVTSFELSLSTGICQKPLIASILEKYFVPGISVKISSVVES